MVTDRPERGGSRLCGSSSLDGRLRNPEPPHVNPRCHAPVRVLLITQILPYPPDAGPRVKTWHVLRYLVGEGHKVRLVSFLRPEEARHLPVIQEMCEEVRAIPLRRSRAADAVYWARSYLKARPFLVGRDDRAGMRRATLETLASRDVDLIHADQLTMTQFAPPANGEAPGPARVFDAHNATWRILEQMNRNAPRWIRPVLATEASRLRQYEGTVVRTFDHTLVVTEADRQALLAAADSLDPARPTDREGLSVIPIAVDTKELQLVERRAASTEILTLGTLHYAPNAEGIRWFLRRVLPLVQLKVPSATLTIVGRNAPADFHRTARESSGAVRVTGYLEDLRPVLQRAALVAVPVLSGSGMRVRILEALARGLPVVTTTIGAEGIEARPGEELLIGDTEEEFAAAIVRLMEDPEFARRLSQIGRRLAVTRYDWKVVLRGLEAAYDAALRRRIATRRAKGAAPDAW